MSGQFSQPRFRHTCSQLRFLVSVILNIVMHQCGFLCLQMGYSEFVVDFVKILTEVGKI